MTNEQLAIFLSKIRDQLSDVIDDMRSDLEDLEAEFSISLKRDKPLFGIEDFVILDNLANLWYMLGDDIDTLLEGEKE